MSSSSEDQLISFFLYSFIIYPITGYLISPNRSYSRWKGALYAILFLISIALIHNAYENMEKGPNFYQILKANRGTSLSALKKSYRTLSLELHPDKNKSPTAEEDFRKVQLAFDTISNVDTKRAYNLLGETGVKIVTKGAVDLKYIVVQMMVYYGSSLIFAFFMTFSESSGDALITSMYGLSVMLLVESLLMIEEWELPLWFFPSYTSYDIIAILHRLYPVFINCSRVVTGALYIDRRVDTSKRLAIIWSLVDSNIAMAGNIAERIKLSVSKSLRSKGYIESNHFNRDNSSNTGGIKEEEEEEKEGYMKMSIQHAESGCRGKSFLALKEPVKGLSNTKTNQNVIFFRNLSFYIVACYVYTIYKSKKG